MAGPGFSSACCTGSCSSPASRPPRIWRKRPPSRISTSGRRSCPRPGSPRSSSSWPPTSKWPASTTALRPWAPPRWRRCSRSAPGNRPAGTAAPRSTACSSSSFSSTCRESGSAAASPPLAGFSRWPGTAGSRGHSPWCPAPSSPLGATVFVTGFCAAALLADVFWKGLLALPGTPRYDALFSWGSTFGGFALVVVYLLTAIGSLRSFARSPHRLWPTLSAVLAIVITAGASSIVLQGHEPHRPRAVARTRRAGRRLRLHLGHPHPQAAAAGPRPDGNGEKHDVASRKNRSRRRSGRGRDHHDIVRRLLTTR